MADSGIKQIRIKKGDLPNPIGSDSSIYYNLRYRIVSDDKNRTSHWSNINQINYIATNNETGFDPNDIENTNIPHNILVNTGLHTISLSWTMPSLLITNPTDEQKIIQTQQASITEFDIYVQWITDSVAGDWIWLGKSNTNSYSMSYPYGAGLPNAAKFRVQKVTTIKQAFNAATYLITAEQAL